MVAERGFQSKNVDSSKVSNFENDFQFKKHSLRFRSLKTNITTGSVVLFCKVVTERGLTEKGIRRYDISTIFLTQYTFCMEIEKKTWKMHIPWVGYAGKMIETKSSGKYTKRTCNVLQTILINEEKRSKNKR